MKPNGMRKDFKDSWVAECQARRGGKWHTLAEVYNMGDALSIINRSRKLYYSKLRNGHLIAFRVRSKDCLIVV